MIEQNPRYNTPTDDEMNEALKPDWAVACARGQYVLGAQLPTRDGRKMGNAHIIYVHEGSENIQATFSILTDAGTEVRLTAGEVDELFHPPTWVSDVRNVLTKFSTNHPDSLRPGLEWAIARCQALQAQGFPRVRHDVLIKDFKNCLGD